MLLQVFLDALGATEQRVVRPAGFLAFSELRAFGRAVFVPWSPETSAVRARKALAVTIQ